MKKTRRSNIRAFLTSEEGRVAVKSPLTLGVATGSVLLAHAIVGPAAMFCTEDEQCLPHKQRCDWIDCTEPDGAGEVTCWGVCR